MNFRIWVLCVFFLAPASACKRQGNDTPKLGDKGLKTQDQNRDAERLKESRDELSRLNKEAGSNRVNLEALQKKLDGITDQLKNGQSLSDEQKRALELELEAVKKMKMDLEAQLKTLEEKQAKTAKDLEDAKKQASNSGTLGTSGNPFCGAVYYGTEFDCNGRQCGKSDPGYQNVCEITANSKAATGSAPAGSSGFPFCGATYYGTEFDCSGKKCGKSDAEYKNICEITASSKPFQTSGGSSGAQIGVSGYPYCPTPRFGIDFDCNNSRRCAKSDPDYTNVCEIQ